MAELRKAPAPSLIQGITQQSPQSSGQASCLDQVNCINDLLDGVRCRNGSQVIAGYSGRRTEPFCHRMKRSDTEDYLLMISNIGGLEIYNLASGVKATITGTTPTAYMVHTGFALNAFGAATIEDTTFFFNKQISPATDAASETDAREFKALVHFKAAGYREQFSLTILVDGDSYTTTFTTASSENPANEQEIRTSYIATQFTTNLNGTVATAMAGDGHTFSAERFGSTIIITGDEDFTVECHDGAGDTNVIGFYDRARSIDDLPKSAEDGYQVAVGDPEDINGDDYYLQYDATGQSPTSGDWVEIVKWETVVDFDPDTMPHQLLNTGLNAFTISTASWGARLAGDAIDTAQDPGFVGDYIRSMNFSEGRMVIIREGGWTSSKAGNAYVFFPDTAQTVLDDAPIDYNIATGKTTLLTQSIVVGDYLQLWSDGSQLRIQSGDQTLKEETVEIKTNSTYAYDGRLPPINLGLGSALFITGRGRYNTIREVVHRQGIPQGEVVLNGHCPKLLDGTAMGLWADDDTRFIFTVMDEDPVTVYAYQWFNQGNERLQSAWNKWTFTGPYDIIWMGISGTTCYIICNWHDYHTLEAIPLEYEGDEDGVVPLRADHRVDESYVNEGNSTSSYLEVDLPYGVPSTNRGNFVAYERVTDGGTGEVRGNPLTLTWVDNTTVRITTENEDLRFWIGALVPSYRTCLPLYPQDDRTGTIPLDDLYVDHVQVFHRRASYYEVLATPKNATRSAPGGTFQAQAKSDAQVAGSDIVVEDIGHKKFKIGLNRENFDLQLYNDTIFPASWEALNYHYRFEYR